MTENKSKWIILFIIMLLTGCTTSSYRDCEIRCHQLHNCSIQSIGTLCIPPPCPPLCDRTVGEFCFNQCRFVK
jgi:hypothetical protein